MATKKQFEAELSKWNGTAEIGDPADMDYVIYAWSPSGKVWAATQGHVICRQFRNSSESWKPEAFQELIDEMRDGVDQCTDLQCEHCHE